MDKNHSFIMYDAQYACLSLAIRVLNGNFILFFTKILNDIYNNNKNKKFLVKKYEIINEHKQTWCANMLRSHFSI